MVKTKQTFKQKWIPDMQFTKYVLIVLMPVIIGTMLDNAIYFLDNFMAAPLGESGMAAVGAVNEIMFMISMAVIGAAAMTDIILAQVYGAKDEKRFHDYLRVKLFIMNTIAILSLIIIIIWPEPFIRVFVIGKNGTDDFINQAVIYLRLMMIAKFVWIIGYAFLTSLTTMGHTKYTLYISLTSLIINFTFNYIFIYIFNMGIAGLAYSTIISRATEGLILILCVIKHKKWLLPLDGFWFTKNHLKKVLKNWKIWVGQFIWCAGLVAQTIVWSNYYGESYLAGVAIAYAIAGIMFTIFPSISTSVRIIVGHELGAGNIEEAKEKSKKIFPIIGGITLSLMTLTVILGFAIPWKNFISGDATKASEFIFWAVIIMIIVMPFLTITAYSFANLEAGGFTIMSTILDRLIQLFILIPISILLAQFTSLNIMAVFGIIYAINALPCLWAWPVYLRGNWARKIIE